MFSISFSYITAGELNTRILINTCADNSQYTANTSWAAQRHVVGRGPAHWKVNRAHLFTVSSFTRWNVCSWLRAARIAHNAPAITSTQVRTTYGKSLPYTVPYETVNVCKIYDNVHGISHFSLCSSCETARKGKEGNKNPEFIETYQFKIQTLSRKRILYLDFISLILYIFNFILLNIDIF